LSNTLKSEKEKKNIAHIKAA